MKENHYLNSLLRMNDLIEKRLFLAAFLGLEFLIGWLDYLSSPLV